MQSESGRDRRRTGHVDGVGTLGMKIFIASLSFIFGATILLYVLLLAKDEAPDVRVLPVVGIGLVVSTVAIVASSVTLRRATRAIAADDRDGLFRWLRWTLLLGLAFGLVQSINWIVLWQSGVSFEPTNRDSGLFVVVTSVHALHVIGGVVRLLQVTSRAGRNAYSGGDHEQVTTLALYWHFLDVVWVLLVVAIVLMTS